ncbi:MAG: prolipoprotein diacylglyceryl transferase [Anaerolineae bacterium]|nr:prolipoprotein diacylglyceryl transferase [Anaerolineae bacterium]
MEFQSEYILMSVGGSEIQIRYYGIIIVTAMLIAASVASRLANRSGRDADHIWGGLTWAIFPGIVGARLWYVLFPPISAVEAGLDRAYYFQNFLNTTDGAIAVWSGGLSIFGAVIGGLLGTWLYFGPLHNRVAKFFHFLFITLPGGPILLGAIYPLFVEQAAWLFNVLMAGLVIIWIFPYATWAFRTVLNRMRGEESDPFQLPPFESDFPEEGIPLMPWLDFAAIALPLAQSIGRWANFINQELYGLPTKLPWGLSIDLNNRVDPYRVAADYPFPGDPAETKFHPLFLYESLWNLIAFFVLLNLYNRYQDKFSQGDFFLMYLMQYSFVRFLLEFIRVEQALVGGINTSQVITGIVFVVALIAFVMRRNRAGDKSDSLATESL